MHDTNEEDDDRNAVIGCKSHNQLLCTVGIETGIIHLTETVFSSSVVRFL